MPDSGGMPVTRTTCPYCGVGCGVLARRISPDRVEVAGDPDHPANFGRLCSKGAALGETVGLEGRLLHPEIEGRRADWETAVRHVADRFSATIAEHGADSVAFYVSGQLLTEDYYVANKLMKGFIGTANIDTNSRLCMASSVAGHRRAFGSDTVPGTYEDLEFADLVVLTGSNLAWCHPVLFQRLMAAREKRPGMQIVVIDPRRTPTADMADLHLPIRAGGDVALFNGLLTWLRAKGLTDEAYVAAHTTGLANALDAAAQDIDETAELTGIDRRDLNTFFRLFAANERVVTVYSQGVNQAADGTDRVNAIINCHLLTGRIGRPGMGPFSVTGQPNAMGGREVGGLANQLACHLELEEPEHRRLVQEFWASPRIAERSGLKAVDLFRAVASGRIKAIWIMATNPVVSLPEADLVRRALADCPFVVVSDVERGSDTAALADVLLPAAAWGEKDGTVTNSERRISRQRGFLPLPGEVHPDWRIVCDVAAAMGFGEAFDYDGPAEIFAEYAALSAEGNDGTRDFDIGALSDLTRNAYDVLRPFQWPLRASGETEARFFARGGFYTPDRRARFIATAAQARPYPAEETLTLNTGRIRDQWHTMTRTGRSPRLSGHLAEPFAALNPADAARLGIGKAELVELSNGLGRAVLRALITSSQPEGTVFVPMHWSGQWSGAARIDVLVPGATDPISGQPALKAARVTASAFRPAWYGFGVALERPAADDLAYWAVARSGPGYRFECAGDGDMADPALAACLLGIPPEAGLETLHYLDNAAGAFRVAAFDGDRLAAAFIAGPAPVAAERNWLTGLLGKRMADSRERALLLAGRPGDANAGPGALICSCNGVGANAIRAAIAGGACTVRGVGEATQAGTGCGSCQSEIGRMLEDAPVAEAV
ncbi:MAG: molybdopterin-dependent oxidoreductase [Minwuia sp.]|uniref:nitrate reductase n=1 Tax=Minwuia sp. TaxID=2493630 RepID=UPI003A86EEA4